MSTLFFPFLLLAYCAPFAEHPGSTQDLATLKLEPVEVPLPAGETLMAERGTLWVPIVRSNPESKKIGIDVWRFKTSNSASPKAPPIFLLHGGPGWPGMEPSTVAWRGNIEQSTRVSDCIVVGQRGIGTSTDTSCDVAFEGKEAVPSDASSLEEQSAYLRARCLDCKTHWEALGYDLSGFNVKEAAADVADVRRLLGYDKISLWGVSFGSHWGMTIMRYHPQIVARALLSGMEGPNHTYDSPSGVLDGIKLMAKAAEASPGLAEFLPESGLIEGFSALIDEVDQEPFELEIRHPRSGQAVSVLIDGDALRGVAMGMGSRINSRGGMPAWPASIITLLNGDFEPLARHLLANQGAPSLPTASFFMLDCGSGITQARLKALKSDPASRIVGNLESFYESTCSVWNSDLGDDFRSNFVSEIPTVVVHGLWDVSTPFSNALECIPLFRNLKLIPVDGGSHGALGEAMRMQSGFEDAILGFLETGATEGLPDEVRLPEVDWVIPRD